MGPRRPADDPPPARPPDPTPAPGPARLPLVDRVASGAGHPDRWKILAVLCGALSIVVLDNTILAVAVPSLGDDLGANETALQWITAAYSLVLAALLLPLAGLGDRFGRKGLLLVGVTVFGVASAGAAVAATSGQLIVARGLMGIGGAATMPATLAVLGNVFAEEERGRAIAVWSGVSSIAGGAGPLVAGVLLAHFWWGSVFLVNVPCTIAVFLLARRLVPTSKDPATPPIDVVGSLLWSGALGLVLFALIQGGERGVGPVAIGSVVVGAGLLVAFIRWERHTEHPLLAPAALADRRMQAGMMVVPVVFFSVFGSQFVLTQWLQGVQGLSPLVAGLCFVPNAVLVLGGSLLSTLVVTRLGLGRAAAVGMGLLAVAFCLGAAWHGSTAPVVVAIALAGLGVGLAVPPGVELIMGSVPPDQAGQAAGVNETIIEAGGAFGIAAMGTVLAVVAGGVGSIAPDQLTGAGGAAARQAFTDALAAPLLVAIALIVAAAIVVVRRTTGTAAGRPGGPDAEVAVNVGGVVATGPIERPRLGGDVSAGTGGGDRPVTRRLVIDSDGGVDDCTALWWALGAPEVEVVALSATWGNTSRDQAAANLRRVLHAAGRDEVPIALGASGPIGPSPLAGEAAHVHGADGLGGHAGGWPTGPVSPVAEPAAEMLARLAAEQPDRLDLVTIGPLSTVARALAAAPGLAEGYRSVTVMGGSIAAGGNAMPAAEANVAHDPEAAAAVVAAPWVTEEPPLLVGLDATLGATLRIDRELAAAQASATVAARFLAGPLSGYAAFYERMGQTAGGTFPCHDLLAVMAAADAPVIVDVATLPLAVDTGASAAWGATVADRRPIPEIDLEGFTPWRVALTADVARFRAALRSLL